MQRQPKRLRKRFNCIAECGGEMMVEKREITFCYLFSSCQLSTLEQCPFPLFHFCFCLKPLTTIILSI